MPFPEFAEAPPSLSGKRVTLRPWREQDLPMLAAAFAIEDVAASMRPPIPTGIGGARQWVDARRAMPARRRGTSYAVAAADPRTAIGSVELRARGRDRHTMEIGYWLVPDARGRGVAREAVGLAVSWAFERTDAGSIIAVIDIGNAPSQRLAVSLGFECRERLDSNDGWAGDWLLFERRRPPVS